MVEPCSGIVSTCTRQLYKPWGRAFAFAGHTPWTADGGGFALLLTGEDPEERSENGCLGCLYAARWLPVVVRVLLGCEGQVVPKEVI